MSWNCLIGITISSCSWVSFVCGIHLAGEHWVPFSVWHWFNEGFFCFQWIPSGIHFLVIRVWVIVVLFNCSVSQSVYTNCSVSQSVYTNSILYWYICLQSVILELSSSWLLQCFTFLFTLFYKDAVEVQAFRAKRLSQGPTRFVLLALSLQFPNF